MTLNQHGRHELGCTSTTMGIINEQQWFGRSKSQNRSLSTDWFLKLETMKAESLVIAYHHGAVNPFLDFVHTARHGLGACLLKVGRSGECATLIRG